jgi:imidazolonepropionase-like amidohydrolase
VRFKDKFSGSGDYDPAGFARMQAAIGINGRLFNEARRAGVKLVMGTDAVAGGFGHQADEIIARVNLGQPAIDAIDDATSVNAESLRLGNEIGNVAAGYDADIIAVDGDPLKDATRLRQVSFVMKGGTVYKDTASAR